MNIAYLSFSGGGVDPYVRACAQWLVSRGHSIHIIYLDKKIPDWINTRIPNIYVHQTATSNVHYYVNRLGFRQYSARLKQYESSLSLSKVLHSIQLKYGLDLAELPEGIAHPFLFQDIPFIIRLHGSNWTFNHYCGDGAIYRFQINNEQHILNAACQIQSPSRSMADFIIGACKIPPSRIRVMPPSIDLNTFTVGMPDRKEPYRIISVGRLEKRKGTHLTIRALKNVWQHQPNTHLYLYGRNGDFGQEQIESEISPQEHKGRIHFAGFISRDELIKQYHQAHVVVAPTLYESFGLAILEAMACSCPVIGTDIGAVPEIVRHKETGWLIPRDDSDTLAKTILEALQRPEQREAYGRAGRLFAERFDIERIMPRQLALYEEAIETYKSKAK